MQNSASHWSKLSGGRLIEISLHLADDAVAGSKRFGFAAHVMQPADEEVRVVGVVLRVVGMRPWCLKRLPASRIGKLLLCDDELPRLLA